MTQLCVCLCVSVFLFLLHVYVLNPWCVLSSVMEKSSNLLNYFEKYRVAVTVM